MNDHTIAFLKSAYREFYFKKANEIDFPVEIQSREFGYIPFGGNMIRHLSFKTAGEAIVEIVRQSPSSVYCSNARYSSPTLPMEEKGWLGASLIFDIDATDIPTPCKRTHDVWYCEVCRTSGKMPKPTSCPSCKKPVQVLHGTCSTCLETARQHTLRVIDFLVRDFGVAADMIKTYFSGSRGYHLYILDRRFDLLDQEARAEVAEYIRGSSLPPSNTIWASLKHAGPKSEPFRGWTERIASAVGYAPDQANHPRKSVAQAIASQAGRIDAAVTTDVHRIFRLAGTLHGTSGMRKTLVNPEDDSNPTTGAVVLSEAEAKVNVDFYPTFSIKGREFGPYKSEVVMLPTYATIGILTRGLGEVV